METVGELLTGVTRLEQVYPACHACKACALHKEAKRVGGRVAHRGDPDPALIDYVVVIDQVDILATGHRLFGGATWEMLAGCFNRAGLNQAEVWVTPATLCIPRRGGEAEGSSQKGAKRQPTLVKVEDAHVKRCAARVHLEIQLAQPLLVIAMGAKAVLSLFPKGEKPGLEAYEGKVVPCPTQGVYGAYDIPVLISYAPTTLIRQGDTRLYGNLDRFEQTLHYAVQIVQAAKEIKLGKQV